MYHILLFCKMMDRYGSSGDVAEPQNMDLADNNRAWMLVFMPGFSCAVGTGQARTGDQQFAKTIWSCRQVHHHPYLVCSRMNIVGNCDMIQLTDRSPDGMAARQLPEEMLWPCTCSGMNIVSDCDMVEPTDRLVMYRMAGGHANFRKK